MDIKILEQAIQSGATIALSHYGKIEPLQGKSVESDDSHTVWEKSAISEADIAVQVAVMQSILESGIDMGIICEESGEEIKKLEEQFLHKNKFVESKLTLVIDPIDGTGNYLSATRGHPDFEKNKHNHNFWGVSGAIFQGSECIMGVIEYPALGLKLVTQKEKGTTINGKKINVVKNEFSEESIVRASGSVKEKRLKELFPNQTHDQRCMVARLLSYVGYEGMTKIDAYIGEYVPVYDLACAPLAYAEAGGFVIDDNGKECNPFEELIFDGEIRQKKRFYFVPTKEFGFSLLAYIQQPEHAAED